MSDFAWIVLFAVGGYLLAIFFGILKSAIDDNIRKIRHKDQLKAYSPASKRKTKHANEESLSTEDSEGDGLILFDDIWFPSESSED